jgi:hypothetical protein
MSPLDATLVALAEIGGDPETTLAKLETLDIGMAFSHIRAIALTLMRNPAPEATAALERLLSSPGASGYAIRTLHEALKSNRPDYNDTTYRNDQLKEIYLGKALAACCPGSDIARKVLESYFKGLQGVFAIFAGV